MFETKLAIAHQRALGARPASLGPWLPGTVLLMGLSAWLLWPAFDVDSVRALIRATARVSLFCFLMAFTAEAAWRLQPAPATRWWRQHRRQWGVLLVTSHTVHLACILAFRHMDPAGFQALVPQVTIYTGILAYAFLWAMGLSSNDMVARWMGKPAWSRLHTWGSHYLWVSFLVAYGKRVPMDAIYALPVGLLLSALWLRWLSKRRE